MTSAWKVSEAAESLEKILRTPTFRALNKVRNELGTEAVVGRLELPPDPVRVAALKTAMATEDTAVGVESINCRLERMEAVQNGVATDVEEIEVKQDVMAANVEVINAKLGAVAAEQKRSSAEISRANKITFILMTITIFVSVSIPILVALLLQR